MEKTTNEAKNNLKTEKENNVMLVRSNLELKEKSEKSEIKYGNLLKNVKNAAPWLEKYMNYVEKCRKEEEDNRTAIDIKLLQQISSKIEEHLSDFVEKDSSPFMTNLM